VTRCGRLPEPTKVLGFFADIETYLFITCRGFHPLEQLMTNLEWYQLYSDNEPIVEKELLNKLLSSGAYATFALVRHKGEYKAMLYVNGKRINGPPLPQPLSAPKDEVTHWMGNKPGVGLTTSEAEMIADAVSQRIERTARN
jgi:hypothetical protein